MLPYKQHFSSLHEGFTISSLGNHAINVYTTGRRAAKVIATIPACLKISCYLILTHQYPHTLTEQVEDLHPQRRGSEDHVGDGEVGPGQHLARVSTLHNATISDETITTAWLPFGTHDAALASERPYAPGRFTAFVLITDQPLTTNQ